MSASPYRAFPVGGPPATAMGQNVPPETPCIRSTCAVPVGHFLPTSFLVPPLSGLPSATVGQMVQNPRAALRRGVSTYVFSLLSLCLAPAGIIPPHWCKTA